LSFEAAGRATFAYPSPLFERDRDRHLFVNVALQDLYSHGDALGAGTVVFDREHNNPIQKALRAVQAVGTPLYGAPLVQTLRRALSEERRIVYESFVPMSPREGMRVTLGDVKDKNGLA